MPGCSSGTAIRDRGLELALGGLEVSHAAQHIAEHPAAAALLQRIMPVAAVLAQPGGELARVVEPRASRAATTG